MSKDEKIRKSIDVLKNGINSLPEGELREDLEGAVNFLSRIFGGGENPIPKIIRCPVDTEILE